MWEWMGLFLRKNHLLRCWGWLSLLIWIGALTMSLLLKLTPRKLELWFALWSFFLLRLLCISLNLPYTNLLCMEYCCHVCAGAPSCYLELGKQQKWICRTVGPSLAASLEPLAHCWNVASLKVFSIGIALKGRSPELAQLVPLPLTWGRSTHSDRFHDFSVTIPRYYKHVYVNTTVSFLAQLDSGILCL